MKVLKFLIVSVVLLFFISVNSFAQLSSDSNRFKKWLIHDPVSLSQNLSSKSILVVGGAGLGLALLSIIDESSSSSFQKNYSDVGFLNFSNTVGDVKIMTPLSVAVFGSSLLTRNTKFQDASFTSLQSVLYTYFSVNVLKFAVARSRPLENEGAFDINFFQLYKTSFPSGHTSNAFAVLTPWVVYYPGPLTYSLMIIPVGTGIARIANGKHWATDVMAGALIGAYWGYSLARNHLNKNEPKIVVVPFFERNGGGLTLSTSF